MSNFEGTINSHISNSDTKQDAGQIIKPIPENKIEKVVKKVLVKAAIGTGVIGMGMGFAACAPAEAAEQVDVVVMATAEPTDSLIPEDTPANDQSNLVDETDNQAEATDTADNTKPEETIDFGELFALAPDVNGLNKETQDDKVLYTYQEGNPYGGEVGEYAGVYKDNVTIEGEKVGGVCMEAKVCQKLLEDALAEIPDGEPKVKVVIPLDVTNNDGDVRVEAVHYNEAVWYACLFDGQLIFVSAYPEDSTIVTTSLLGENNLLPTDDGRRIDATVNVFNSKAIWFDSNESFIETEGLFYGFPENGSSLEGQNMKYNADFGQTVCQVDSSIVIGFTSVSEQGTIEASMYPSSFLRFDNGSLVFMSASSETVTPVDNQ